MSAPIRLPNLTQYERVGIDREFNLSDGHAHQFADPAQREIVDRLPKLYLDSETARQADVEEAFRETFFRVAGQESAIRSVRTLLTYSASLSIDLVGAYLRAEGLTVGLLQPCFDNLAALLKLRGVRLVPIGEEEVAGPRITAAVARDRLDAVFITMPNNPTGYLLDRDAFRGLAERCAATNTLLIIDWTFRFFDDACLTDQYAVLDDAAVPYICIEDTGKTWPTLDLKCSILAASADVFPALRALHSDVLLNVSPFVLTVLTEFLADSARRGLDRTIREPVRRNRRRLQGALRGSYLSPCHADRSISVEWVRIAPGAPGGVRLTASLDRSGIAILPGEHFFWHDPRLGARYVRFALARDEERFAAACRLLREILTGSSPAGSAVR